MEISPLTKVVIGVALVGAISAAIFLGRYGGNLSVRDSNNGGASQTDSSNGSSGENPLPISPKGPYPKVVVDEPDHNFGLIAVGSEGKHVFIIRNEGEAPLRLKQGDTTCKCTISNVGEDAIPPGGSAEVELVWKASAANDEFRQSADVWTTDPKLEKLELSITGTISEKIEVNPEGGWILNTEVRDQPITVTGQVFSKLLDSFNFDGSIQSSSPLLSAEITPMSAAESAAFRAKSGYMIKATLKPEIPVGRFRETLTFHVDVPGVDPVIIPITGTRTGPVSILSAGATLWYPQSMYIDLEQFDSEKGAKATLLMYVDGMENKELELVSSDVDPKFIKLHIQRDPDFQGGTRKKYLLTIEIPPGSPPLTRGSDRPAIIIIKTNHPEAPELKLRMQFFSR